MNDIMAKNVKTMRLYRLLPAIALLLAKNSVSAMCFFCLYQPDVPKQLIQENRFDAV